MFIPRPFILLPMVAFTFCSISVRAHDEVFLSDVSTEAKPWTNLEFQNDPDNFQFAIITDRTGGPREGVFEDAMQKLNWMMPEFVLSVGDFIDGTSENAATNSAEWDKMMERVSPLKMPLFFVAGNHDIQMKILENRVKPEVMLKEWNTRFGPTHYSFVYKNVLFVVLFTNDGKEQHISEAQADYFDGVMAANPDVRWTIVSLHHPLWTYPHHSNFDRIEKALAGRKHTVYAGHHHRYVHFDRSDANYYILASTGGASKMRGHAFGEFDHFAWVTMTDDGPIMANLDLAGILPHDLANLDSVAQMRALEQSAHIESDVVLAEAEHVQGGAVFLTLSNASDEALQFTGEFRHSHHVHPIQGRVSRLVPPRSREVVEVDLAIQQPFSTRDQVLLEFVGTVSYAEGGAPGMELPLDTLVTLVGGYIDFWGTESAVFVDEIKLAPRYSRDDRVVRYTLDGSTPTENSPRFDREIAVKQSGVVKASLFTGTGLTSAIADLTLVKISAGAGLLAHYYELNTDGGPPKVLPNFAALSPTYTKSVTNFDLAQLIRRPEDFGAVFFGSIEVLENGNYGFHINSANGTRLLIDGKVIIDEPTKHGSHETTGFATLKPGKHRIEVQFFQADRYSLWEVALTTPQGERHAVTDAQLSFDQNSAPDLKGPNKSK
jgi:predicted phosphodiesterase